MFRNEFLYNINNKIEKDNTFKTYNFCSYQKFNSYPAKQQYYQNSLSTKWSRKKLFHQGSLEQPDRNLLRERIQRLKDLDTNFNIKPVTISTYKSLHTNQNDAKTFTKDFIPVQRHIILHHKPKTSLRDCTNYLKSFPVNTTENNKQNYAPTCCKSYPRNYTALHTFKHDDLCLGTSGDDTDTEQYPKFKSSNSDLTFELFKKTFPIKLTTTHNRYDAKQSRSLCYTNYNTFLPKLSSYQKLFTPIRSAQNLKLNDNEFISPIAANHPNTPQKKSYLPKLKSALKSQPSNNKKLHYWDETDCNIISPNIEYYQ